MRRGDDHEGEKEREGERVRLSGGRKKGGEAYYTLTYSVVRAFVAAACGDPVIISGLVAVSQRPLRRAAMLRGASTAVPTCLGMYSRGESIIGYVG